jgi:acyl-CoA reductase-like NAD-dependent aldehyde dehydrogenase
MAVPLCIRNNDGHFSGKTYGLAKIVDIGGAIDVFRYYAGWADKVHGQTIEVCPTLLTIAHSD